MAEEPEEPQWEPDEGEEVPPDPEVEEDVEEEGEEEEVEEEAPEPEPVSAAGGSEEPQRPDWGWFPQPTAPPPPPYYPAVPPQPTMQGGEQGLPQLTFEDVVRDPAAAIRNGARGEVLAALDQFATAVNQRLQQERRGLIYTSVAGTAAAGQEHVKKIVEADPAYKHPAVRREMDKAVGGFVTDAIQALDRGDMVNGVGMLNELKKPDFWKKVMRLAKSSVDYQGAPPTSPISVKGGKLEGKGAAPAPTDDDIALDEEAVMVLRKKGVDINSYKKKLREAAKQRKKLGWGW